MSLVLRGDLARIIEALVLNSSLRPCRTAKLHTGLATKHGGKISIITYISADEDVNKMSGQRFKTKLGRIDIVFACAGSVSY